jgi:Tol biopolymer transport system component
MAITRNRFLAYVAVAALLISCTPRASATFPGRNGRIAFVMGPNVFTMNDDGSNVKQLTSFAANEATFGEDWSPDGTRVVFGRGMADFSASAIWIMNADGSNQHQLLNDPSGFGDEPRFSPDGSHVVFQRCIPPSLSACSIFRIRADGTDFTQLTPYSDNTDEEDLTPAYSPDGKTIAFFGFDRDGIISAIDVMNADGANIQQLTPAVLEAFIPDWSPDGTKIVFSTRAAYPSNTINPQLWIMNANGTGIMQVTFPGAAAADTFVSWAPQGNAIVFERDTATSSGIYVKTVSEAGSTEKLIFRAPGRANLGSIQPPQTSGKFAGRFAAAAKTSAWRIESGGSSPRWGPAPK